MLFSKTLHTISRRRAHYSKRREMILLHRKLTHTPGLIRSSCKMAQVALKSTAKRTVVVTNSFMKVFILLDCYFALWRGTSTSSQFR